MRGVFDQIEAGAIAHYRTGKFQNKAWNIHCPNLAPFILLPKIVIVWDVYFAIQE